jgi:uncharacterized NAD(P)/FAD-binding protein YdhS
VLIERAAVVGRGVAYAQRDFPYLLNVPTGRMSAAAHAPLQFLQFAQRRIPNVSAADFVPRSLYGEYLEELLLAAQLSAPAHVRLQIWQGEVVAVRRIERHLPLRVELGDGRALTADDVVLATGNPPPADVGVILSMRPAGERIDVTWRPRGARTVQQLRVDRVINCTGPDHASACSSQPLWRNLLQCGLCVADELGLGVRTGPGGAVIDSEGWAGPHLFYVGPMLRADHWEATAVAELRVHVEQLAATLAAPRSGARLGAMG